ncbi:alanine racemase [Stappia sp. F7233]|uniref:Alanine racemase n=1 Tax=Stappia albiluteola TaxID=2758565 RepID=A0A839ADK6_9HYPH|nr:alanine racemase [Stappia albiluteola]MBA5776719.1 alanine racemase [Stappia albiluteola]
MPQGAFETPCLLLDRAKLAANIASMAARFRTIGVPLRPHLKTAKSIDVARLCQAHGADRWTVSTLREAEYFASHGLSDMLYAVSIVPAKIDRVMALNRTGANVAVCLDTMEGADALAAALPEGPPLRVFLEIDVDHHRTGLQPGETRLIDIATRIHSTERLVLAGVMAHGGESYASRSLAEIEAMAEQERRITVAAAEAIRADGIPCPTVSVGSTPTARFGTSYEGVDEVRAGVYMFQDVFQSNLGVCPPDAIALSVLTSVVSHAPHLNRLVIDAGGMALSKDRSCAIQENDCGYGFLTDEVGRLIPGLYVNGVSQEHGYVTTRDGSPLDLNRFPVGSLLRVLPNHACMTAAAYDAYHVAEADGHIAEVWPRVNGWSLYTP